MPQAVLIAKTDSRHGLEAFGLVSAGLQKRGFSIAEAHKVADRRELKKRVRGAVRSGHRLIVVAGGDGTQTTAVGELAYTDAVLGVIPAGTGNSFALSLGIKSDIEEAIEVIARGRVCEVDLGVVNGTYFANFATIGMSAEIGADTPKWLKRITGPVAYGISAIGPLVTGRAFRAKVFWEKNALRLETFQMIIANGRYFGETPVVPDASITDGRLTFFTTAGARRMDILRMYFAFLRDKQTELPDAHYFQTKKIKIKTSKPQPIALDGSSFGTTPAKFSIAKKALKVMVPMHSVEAV